MIHFTVHADDGVAAGGDEVGLAGAGERRVSQPEEGLIAGHETVGVDARQVDLVGIVDEVGNDVVVSGARQAVAGTVIVVEVAPGAAGGDVAAGASLE